MTAVMTDSHAGATNVGGSYNGGVDAEYDASKDNEISEALDKVMDVISGLKDGTANSDDLASALKTLSNYGVSIEELKKMMPEAMPKGDVSLLADYLGALDKYLSLAQKASAEFDDDAAFDKTLKDLQMQKQVLEQFKEPIKQLRQDLQNALTEVDSGNDDHKTKSIKRVLIKTILAALTALAEVMEGAIQAHVDVMTLTKDNVRYMNNVTAAMTSFNKVQPWPTITDEATGEKRAMTTAEFLYYAVNGGGGDEMGGAAANAKEFIEVLKGLKDANGKSILDAMMDKSKSNGGEMFSDEDANNLLGAFYAKMNFIDAGNDTTFTPRYDDAGRILINYPDFSTQVSTRANSYTSAASSASQSAQSELNLLLNQSQVPFKVIAEAISNFKEVLNAILR